MSKHHGEKHTAILNSFSDYCDNDIWKDWCECAGLEVDDELNSMEQVEEVLKNGLNENDVNAIYDCLQTNGVI